MKKFVLGCLLFCGSINVYADGEVTVYGYPYASPSNLGSFTGGSIPSGGLTSFGGMSKEAYAQMIAAQAAGEAAAKKQYCKDNNYPTSAPFCAALKAEADAHKKFCAEYPTAVTQAVQKCTLDANSYRDYFVATYCDSGTSSSWSLSAPVGKGQVSHSVTINSGAFCREDAKNAMNTLILRCEYSGGVVLNAVKQQCSDVQ